MYRSRRKEEQLRLYLMIGAACLLAVAILAVALVVTSSGSKQAKASGCAILDVSESTEDARPVYTEDFAKFATEIGNEGTGDICIILAGRDPLAESVPIERSVAPLPVNVGTPMGPVEIEENVNKLTAEVAAVFENPGVDNHGSGLIEAANVAAKELKPGDRLLYLSDGLQWTPSAGRLLKMDLSAAGIGRYIQQLRTDDLLPELRGVTVEFPRLLYHPGGIEVTAAQKKGVIAFWEAWARATGARLDAEAA